MNLRVQNIKKIRFLLGVALPTLLLMVGWQAQAQNLNALHEKLNQLQEKTNFATDTAYLNVVNKLAFEYANTNTDSAFLLIRPQLQRCRAAKYSRGEVEALKVLGNAFTSSGEFDSAFTYYNAALALATKIDHKAAMPALLNNIGILYVQQGNYPSALTNYFKALKLAEQLNNAFVHGATLNNIAEIYFIQGKFADAEQNYLKLLELARQNGDSAAVVLGFRNLAETLLAQGFTDSALGSTNTALRLASEINDAEMKESSLRMAAIVYTAMDSLGKAVKCYRQAADLAVEIGQNSALCQSLLGLANAHLLLNEPQLAMPYAKQGLAMAAQMGQVQLMRDANEVLAKLYEADGNTAEALKYFKAFKADADSINSLAGKRLALSLEADYGFSKRELQFEQQDLKQRWLIFSAFLGLVAVALVAAIFYRGRQRTKHLYEALQHQAAEVQAQKTKLENAIGQLKATQAQLVQSEKMASLAELTAGIAHEIQNPLNFVNNFSEVSTELTEELAEALSKGDYQAAVELAEDVQANLQKILHHGKRADDIVKGMLQHSRASTGEKMPTNLNALADEYLRLAYHGLRAKDNTFNASIKTNLDEKLKPITVVPQDLGRVLLNLITNAFHAVDEKRRLQPPGYVPSVAVETVAGTDRVQLKIIDNGNGIAHAIIDKIFQPFFTTKPAGQGTGLGLSLSYDIVKAHGGELTVETTEGEGSVFIINLP
jgi:two-component system, NtrC family, sensor kinase